LTSANGPSPTPIRIGELLTPLFARPIAHHQQEALAERVAGWDEISWSESKLLVGFETTEHIYALCQYCFDRHERGIPVWSLRIWLGLLHLILEMEAVP
jgi:hypothetical protein